MLKVCFPKVIKPHLLFSRFKNTSIKSNIGNDLLEKYSSRIVFNTILDNEKNKFSLEKNMLRRRCRKFESNISQFSETIPITLKYLDENATKAPEEKSKMKEIQEPITNFPFEANYRVLEGEAEETVEQNDYAEDVDVKIRERVKLQKEMKTWMTDYDNFDDGLLKNDCEDISVFQWNVNYGTPDPNCEVSNVPCGGCGSLLHCKDTSIPGYIPSEIFKNCKKRGGTNLEAITCQRCHFLKNYNIALKTQVAPEDYAKVLHTIKEKNGLIILLIDLLDFPCSIWPGIGEIFGPKFPIVIVGNKIDLLPKDSDDFLNRIKNTLVDYVKLHGFGTFNVKNVALISAKTGYGIEDLITKLGSLYRTKGNVYIIGTTNVGKSSLFNALIQSDYCKSQAIDLIQRATTSIWPGTTLNLLKFPIKRPTGFYKYLRHQRLQIQRVSDAQDKSYRLKKLKYTSDPKYGSLIGHIDITRDPTKKLRIMPNNFGLDGGENASGKLKMGLDERLMEYMYSKWCFDTPGVVHPHQITHLLTTEELLLTLPKEIIQPRSFCIKPGMSLFIAGLSRLDFVQGPGSVRLTVFASNELPITICRLQDADQVYDELLGTELFVVPSKNSDRLTKWPKLESGDKFTVTGIHWRQSAKDVVLSSSGWIAITGKKEFNYDFQAWTPEKRGISLRDCLLPHAIALKGDRLKHNVAYKPHRYYLS